MKKHFLIASVCVGSALGCCALPASAQPDIPGQPVATPNPQTASQWRQIRVRNVLAATMASWVDPQHNSTPVPISTFRRPIVVNTTANRVAREHDALKLPEGVSRVVAIDAQNTLHALSTEAGYEALKKLVQALDKPMRTVEIEVQQIATDDDAAARELRGGNEAGKLQTLDTRLFNETVERLSQEKRIDILNSPRLTALNNTPAEIATWRSTPIPVDSLSVNLPANGVKDTVDAELASLKTAPEAQKTLWISRGKLVRVTPTINNDDTITTSLEVLSPLCLSDNPEESGVVLDPHNELTAIINIQDNKTVYLGGLESKLIAPGTENKKRHQLYFVKASLRQQGG